MIMVRFLASSGASSLLDRTEQEWREAFGKKNNAIALLAWSRREVTDLAEGSGWDAEYPRDAWQMHRLGFEGRYVLNFSRISQQQLKDLAKRWIRWRLSTGLGLEAGGARPLRVLTRLAAFLHARGIAGADGISRAVLEDYLAGLHAAMAGRPEHGTHVSMTGLFLTAVRQHGWAPDLPPDAMIFPGDQPPRTELLPRALAGHVMAQVEQPGNLAREENPAYRLVTLILIRCGLRVSDALRLPFDCVTADDAGAPYLRYFNHKMKREALVPLDDELLGLIRGQQRRVLDRYPSGIVLIPRPEKNPDGTSPVFSRRSRSWPSRRWASSWRPGGLGTGSAGSSWGRAWWTDWAFYWRYGQRGLVAAPGSLPAARAAAWFVNWAWAIPIAGLAFMLLLFPTGRLRSPTRCDRSCLNERPYSQPYSPNFVPRGTQVAMRSATARYAKGP